MYRVEKFIQGMDRNLVVYDSDAPKGEFTGRLFALMQTTARHLEGIKCRLNRWFLPKSVIDQFMEPPSALFPEHDRIEYNRYIMGLEWEEQPEDLLLGIKLRTKLGNDIDYKNWIAKDDIHLVIAESDNGEYLIGSF